MRIKTAVPFHLSSIAEACGGSLLCHDAVIDTITTDSRVCERNDLFIALKGESFDGAIFSKEAKIKGAWVLSEKSAETVDILVESSEKALLCIASEYKRIISPKQTVAITGSVGKTTTKDFTAALVSQSFITHKTKENFNNIIGLSETLLSMQKDTEILICEVGMNHIGEIDVLSRAIRPDISVITNVGTAHIGNLGTRENIAKAKLEIQNGMHGGKTVIPKSEPLLQKANNPYYISYTDENADLLIKILGKEKNKISFSVKTKSYQKKLTTALYSEHHIICLGYAIAVYDILGCDPSDLQSALNQITTEILRQKFIIYHRYKFYDDSYNSSPEAVIENMKMLSKLEKRTSALLGDMLELGESSKEMHRLIGKKCAELGFKKLYALGKYASDIALGAKKAGMSEKDIYINEDAAEYATTAKVIKETYEGETILVKGSHAMGLKKIIDIICESEGEEKC